MATAKRHDDAPARLVVAGPRARTGRAVRHDGFVELLLEGLSEPEREEMVDILRRRGEEERRQAEEQAPPPRQVRRSRPRRTQA